MLQVIVANKFAHVCDHSVCNCQIMQNKEIMVAYKQEKKLKELLTRADPDNIISNVDDEMYMCGTSAPVVWCHVHNTQN